MSGYMWRNSTIMASVAALGLAASALGQDDQMPETGVSQTVDDWQFTIAGEAEYMFDADVDGGGEFNLWRAGGAITAFKRLDLDSELRLSGGFSLDSYDFSDTTGLADPNPWDDIYTAVFAGTYTWHPGTDFTVGMGPLVMFAWESGADFYMGFKGGGFVWGSWEINNALTLGFGLTVVSQIEKTQDIFPIIIINWEISDNLRLANSQSAVPGAGGGIELIYDIDDNWSISLGGGFSDFEFRLDDESEVGGIDGVGQNSYSKIFTRLSYGTGTNLSFWARAGITFSGELQLEDDGGRDIAVQDYDDQWFAGAGLRFRF